MIETKKINQIIDKGLLLEDRMVKIYAKALKGGTLFKNLTDFDRNKVTMLVDTLLKDTTKHQEFLYEIKNNIQNYGK